MLKSIVNGAEHDIVSIPMKGKNLAHANSDRTGSFLTWQKDKSTFTLNGSASAADSLPFSTLDLKAGTYTLSIHGLKEIGTGKTGLYLSGVDTVRVQTNRTYTITEDTTVTLRLVISVSDVSYDNEEITVMFNIGSTALPYEPYGYQNGWEVRDNQNRLIWGREDELQTITGTLPFKGYDLPIKVKSLLGSAVQNGTPSPESPIVPEFCGVRTVNVMPQSEKKIITDNGITFESDGYGRYHVYGTSTANASAKFNLISGFTIPISISNGGQGTLSFFNTQAVGTVRFVFYNGATAVDDWGLIPTNRTHTAYNTLGNKYIDSVAITVSSGTTVDMIISPEFTNDGVLPTEFEQYGYKITFENNGENLFEGSDFSTTVNNVSIITSNQKIRITGTANNNGGRLAPLSNDIVLQPGTYIIKSFGAVNAQLFLQNKSDSSVYHRFDQSTRSFTLTTVTTFYISLNALNGVTYDETITVMLNTGSTPLPYSPYLNKTTPIYLGEVPTIRRIKKLVLTGTENWQIQSGQTVDYFRIPNMPATESKVICTHYQSPDENIAYATVATGIKMQQSASYGVILACRPSLDIPSLTDFKAYLTAQYDAGTPVTVWYILAEPETGITNEPLAKIEGYADELTTIQVHGLSAPLYGIEDYKDTLNLETGIVTRNIKKLVLTGDEDWDITGDAPGYTAYFRLTWFTSAKPSKVVCTHYTSPDENISVNNTVMGAKIQLSSSYGVVIIVRPPEFATWHVADFKSYLAEQYQNGTPVTIWYVLETPITETVTVPTGMTGEIEGYLTQISTPTPEHQNIPKWNGEEETGGTYAVTVYDLPEIETTTGKNTLTVDTTLAPYDVTINGHIKYTYWGKIREDVRSGLAQTKFPVGTILYDNEDESTGRAFQVVGYDKHFDPSLTARGYNHSMTLCQLKLSGPWQFDATEAFLYTTVEMQPGTYKFKIPNYDTTYGGNKTYYFTSTASVPVDSQIILSWAYQQPPKTVTAYAGPNPQTKTTAITGFNALPLSEWIEGESPEAIDLGTIKLANNDPDSAYGKLNHIHRARYGSNNYYQSGLRQLLNTDLASNNWWHPTTIFDRPYANRTTNGYLRSLNEDFINVLATPEITHIANNIFEYPSLDGRTFTLNTEYKINTDKVFLLSHTEVGLSASPNIGTVLDYYSTHNTNNDRIKYRIDNGNAYYWWFRTPYPTHADFFRRCHTSGALNNSVALISYGVAPAHIIQ